MNEKEYFTVTITGVFNFKAMSLFEELKNRGYRVIAINNLDND